MNIWNGGEGEDMFRLIDQILNKPESTHLVGHFNALYDRCSISSTKTANKHVHCVHLLRCT